MKDKELQALRDERVKHIADARKLLDAAETEKRNLNAEDQEQYDKFFDESGKLKERIDAEERQRKVEAELAASAGRQTQATIPEGGSRAAASTETATTQPKEFRYKLSNGVERIYSLEGPHATPKYRAAFNSWLRHGKEITPDESRALQVTPQTLGGFVLPDQQFVGELIKFVDDQVLIRELATVHQVPTADSLGAPSFDTDVADAEWTTELLTGGEDSSARYGKRELVPHPLAKRIKVSKTLLRRSPTMDSFIQSRLAYKIGVTQEKGFMTGDSANKPLGVFTADANGITTGRDISTGNTDTAIGADNLRENKYNLKQQYRNDATLRWIFHRDGVKQISKLKDGEGQYLWQPGITFGDPDSILNIRVLESEFAPNTFTTGLYVGILGVFRHYWIADSLGMAIQRLEELYAETNQTGFISRSETDGMPVLEEAFSRVTLA